jgi:hypothetical protein
MEHYWIKECLECEGTGETKATVDHVDNGDEWHVEETYTCDVCNGEGEVKEEMDDLSEEQYELMDMGFERDADIPTRFTMMFADFEIQIDFPKDAEKVRQFRINSVTIDMYLHDLIERVKALYFGIIGEELTIKN